MALSSKSKEHSLWKTISIMICLILLLLGSCTATRPGKMVMEERKVWSTTMENTELQPGKHETGFEYGGQIFSFFPKGTPIPPSGPSKRHNSAPQN
ncbi:hypothetical protein FNV43_RR27328 [Rhamnella rubrinervis]|uniref:Uncharacterized protein n=1 Tax=Rhamnella rubrinervis TaxID=2594499 RepID=A0A8K0DR04_9ROSA|nr:hypothetical protein FNV43_RR27328 [Rhamnella rubrinervis]